MTPYTVTVANAATYNDDLGVVYAATGKRFNRVTTPSAAGQYSVNFATGVYTFAAADANAALLISYTYNVTTSGNKLTLTNQLMGTTPTFKATFYTTYTGEGAGVAAQCLHRQQIVDADQDRRLDDQRARFHGLCRRVGHDRLSEHRRMMPPQIVRPRCGRRSDPRMMVAMGGQEWTVPPLTLGQLRRLMPKVRQLTEIGAQMGETQIGVLVEIVAAALQRNYPDMTAETVENLLDLGNAGAVLNAVLTGSGLRPRERSPGEARGPRAGPGGGMASVGDRARRRLGTHLRSPRHRLRLQLSA